MIIFLHGTSSSGKTSIANQILQQSRIDFVHLEMDQVFEDDPKSIQENGRTVYVHRPMWLRLECTLAKGSNVILDGFFGSERELSYYIKPFSMAKIYVIRIYAPSEVCTIRESRRADRTHKGVAAYFHKVIESNFLGYDLLIDTSKIKPSKSATKILEFLKINPLPMAFDSKLKGSVASIENEFKICYKEIKD